MPSLINTTSTVYRARYRNRVRPVLALQVEVEVDTPQGKALLRGHLLREPGRLLLVPLTSLEGLERFAGHAADGSEIWEADTLQVVAL